VADFSEHLQSLVDDPRETLNIELKCWLDLTNKDDQATLAKAVIALANHGGGYLVLGFKELGDGTFECHEPRPTTLNGFSQDVIARIVATYADPAIQVSVVRRTRNADGVFTQSWTYPAVIERQSWRRRAALIRKQPLLNFEWVAARIDPSLGPLPEGT
jgi:hypothetical protein